eukprot:7583535-Lingulodinium_polyedra.AAC.1
MSGLVFAPQACVAPAMPPLCRATPRAMVPGPRLRRLALPAEKLRASQELIDAKGKRYRVITV